MTGVREEKKRAARARLFAEAVRLIEAKGYDAVSAAEIAAAAGLAKGTLFNHFPTKAHFIADWYAARTEQALAATARMAGDALAAELTRLALAAIEACAPQPEMWRAKRREAMASEAIQAVEAQSDAAIRARAEKLAALARRSGEIRADVDPAEFADLYTGLISGTASESAATGEQEMRPVLERRISALCALAR
jgi:AcrR family transcriptional regulator